MQFNEAKFWENVQKIHLTEAEELVIYTAVSDAEVRKRLDDFVDCGGNSRFSAALDEICENIVGRTMFKVLIAKLQSRKKFVYIKHHDDDGSYYEKYTVYINLFLYKENGEGVPSRYYFYIDEKGRIKMKLKSLAGSVFHEFCHGLHDVSKTEKRSNILCLDGTPLKHAWGYDEELRTITCFDHDPICDHCFDFCQSILKKEKFLPRYSHGGHSGIGEPNTKKMEKYANCIPASQKFMDGWKEYVLQKIS
jgi:hypothetical protein